MKAITTRYHGPTDTRGGRIIAHDGDGNRHIKTYNYALSVDENHDAAAIALCRRMDWHGTLVSGDTPTGRVYVWLPDADDTLTV